MEYLNKFIIRKAIKFAREHFGKGEKIIIDGDYLNRQIVIEAISRFRGAMGIDSFVAAIIAESTISKTPATLQDVHKSLGPIVASITELLSSEKIRHAFKFAKYYHDGQKRRATGEDYLVHPVITAILFAQYKQSHHIVDLLCAMLLHDTIEDTDATFEEILREFGPLVMSIVRELCNDEDEIRKIGKLAHQKKKLVGISNYALFGKLVDRLHNIIDCPKEKYVHDTLELLAHLKKNRRLTSAQMSVVVDIEKECSKILKTID